MSTNQSQQQTNQDQNSESNDVYTINILDSDVIIKGIDEQEWAENILKKGMKGESLFYMPTYVLSEVYSVSMRNRGHASIADIQNRTLEFLI